MKKFVILFVLIKTSLLAQVGINNPLPDTSTVLDMSGANNKGRGLLLPESDSLEIVPFTSDGLIIRDLISNEIYIYFNDSTQWFSVNPWSQKYREDSIYTYKNVGIGTSTPSQPLDVNGNANVSGNIDASGTVTANKFVGDGIVPSGAIMMWSGTTPPTGWVLCDGKTYNKSDGTVYSGIPGLCVGGSGYPASTITTPNLKGRFVVGYDPNVTAYNTTGNLSQDITCRRVGKTGGAETVTLTTNEMPSHSHTFSGTTSSNGAHTHTSIGSANVNTGPGEFVPTYNSAQTSYTSVNSAGNHTHTYSGTTSSTGNGAAHENRPPYYVLAYIMKL